MHRVIVVCGVAFAALMVLEMVCNRRPGPNNGVLLTKDMIQGQTPKILDQPAAAETPKSLDLHAKKSTIQPPHEVPLQGRPLIYKTPSGFTGGLGALGGLGERRTINAIDESFKLDRTKKSG